MPKRKYLLPRSKSFVNSLRDDWNNSLRLGEEFLARSELSVMKYNVDILTIGVASFDLVDVNLLVLEGKINLSETDSLAISVGNANLDLGFDFSEGKADIGFDAQASIAKVTAQSEYVSIDFLIGSIGVKCKVENGTLKIGFSHGFGFNLAIKLF